MSTPRLPRTGSTGAALGDGSPGSVPLGHLGGGARSQKLDPDQLRLALEEVAQSLGLAESIVESEPATDKPVTSGRKPPQRNRGA
jgi:hypothetical protein